MLNAIFRCRYTQTQKKIETEKHMPVTKQHKMLINTKHSNCVCTISSTKQWSEYIEIDCRKQ